MPTNAELLKQYVEQVGKDDYSRSLNSLKLTATQYYDIVENSTNPTSDQQAAIQATTSRSGSGMGAILASEWAEIPITDLLIFCGQSNAINTGGSPIIDPVYTASHPGLVWRWQEGGGAYYPGAGTADADGSTGNSFITIDTVTADRARYPGYIAMAREMIAAGRTVATVQVGQGSTTLFSDWRPAPNAGAKDLAAVLDNEITQAIAHASSVLTTRYRVHVVFWQGESDATTSRAAVYESRLGELLTHFQAQAWWTNAEEAQLILPMLHEDNPRDSGNASAAVAAIRVAQTNFAAANSSIVSTFETSSYALQADGDHYSAPQAQAIGLQMARKLVVGEGAYVAATELYALAPTNGANYYRTDSTSQSNDAFAGDAAGFTVWAVLHMKSASALIREKGVYVRWSSNAGGIRFLIRDGGTVGRLTVTAVNGAGSNVTLNRNLTAWSAGDVLLIGAVFDAGASTLQVFQNALVAGTATCVGYTPSLTNGVAEILEQTSGVDELSFDTFAIGGSSTVATDAHLTAMRANLPKGLFYLANTNGTNAMIDGDMLLTAEEAAVDWAAQFGGHDGTEWQGAAFDEQGACTTVILDASTLSFPA